MQTDIENFFNGVCCTAPVTYNFDVNSSDWSAVGITNKATFETMSIVTTSDFVLAGNNIKANITTIGNAGIFNLTGKKITSINYINPTTYYYNLYLNYNLLTDFNPTLPLSSGILLLDLSNNSITSFAPTIPLPTGLTTLQLNNNQLTTASYTAMEAWANSLHNAPTPTSTIDLSGNTDSVAGTALEAILVAKGWQVISAVTPPIDYNFSANSTDWTAKGISDQATFDSVLGVTTDYYYSPVATAISANITSLPVSNTLDLSGSNLVILSKCTIPNLTVLDLSNNSMGSITPTHAFPITLQSIDFSNNNFTASGYADSENWALTMHTAPIGGTIDFSGNTDSVSGTELENILVGLGWTVIA
jgi:Leucine-rich repeat (LRR) protein